jgi:hypothetical protein
MSMFASVVVFRQVRPDGLEVVKNYGGFAVDLLRANIKTNGLHRLITEEGGRRSASSMCEIKRRWQRSHEKPRKDQMWPNYTS